MTDSDDPRLCYQADADDRFRSYYVDLGHREFASPDAEGVLAKAVEADLPEKIELLDQLFSVRLVGTRREVDRGGGLDAGTVYDVRYEGRPNTRHLYDILFLPGFHKPAYKLSLSIDGDQVRKLDWWVYTAREFSVVHPGLYGNRYRIARSDRAGARLSHIEILKDRLPAGGFDEWLRKARFAD